MNKKLSAAAGDVLHALFFRGALVDGELPSKSGAAELRELGYVKTQYTVTVFCGENHYNFLTPAGQEFAINYLVDSRFGKKDGEFKAGNVFTCATFISVDLPQPKVMLSPEMRDAVIAAVRDSGQFVEKPTGDEQKSVGFLADRFKVTVSDDAADKASMQELVSQVVNDAIANALRPGGLLFSAVRHN